MERRALQAWTSKGFGNLEVEYGEGHVCVSLYAAASGFDTPAARVCQDTTRTCGARCTKNKCEASVFDSYMLHLGARKAEIG